MNMRGIKILVCALLLNYFAVVGSQTAAASGSSLGATGTEGITSPQTGSPTGSLTEPVSTYNPTLFTVPRTDMASGNMVITGNVGGGRHFRDVVPYSSVTDIQANLESTSLDSFLRYSSAPSQPFYSPTGSISSIKGLSTGGALPQASQKVRGYSGTGEIFTPYSSLTAAQQAASRLTSGYVTMPVTRSDYSRSLLGQVQGYGTAGPFLRLGTESAPPSRLKGAGGSEQSGLLKSELETTVVSGGPKAFEITEQPEQLDRGDKLDIYEQMKEQFGIFEQPPGEQVNREEADELIREAVQKEWQAKVEAVKTGTEKIEERREERRQAMQKAGGEAVGAASTKEKQETTEPKKYKTFASESGDEFNHYMKTAEQYLKEGKFYQASDAYSLASIYKPMDPLSYAGKAHALFGAGEYLSSARWLAYALRLFPSYANVKVDLVEIFGNITLIEVRTKELAKWASETKSVELYVLLAYICYQIDNRVIAQAAINEAYKQMPEDEAVLALKQAIEESGSP